MKIEQKWLIANSAVGADEQASAAGCVGWYLGVPPALLSISQEESWTLPHVWTEVVEIPELDCTDAINSLIASNSNIVIIKLQKGYIIDGTKLDAGVTWSSWQEDWSEGRDLDNSTIIRFLP